MKNISFLFLFTFSVHFSFAQMSFHADSCFRHFDSTYKIAYNNTGYTNRFSESVVKKTKFQKILPDSVSLGVLLSSDRSIFTSIYDENCSAFDFMATGNNLKKTPFLHINPFSFSAGLFIQGRKLCTYSVSFARSYSSLNSGHYFSHSFLLKKTNLDLSFFKPCIRIKINPQKIIPRIGARLIFQNTYLHSTSEYHVAGSYLETWDIQNKTQSAILLISPSVLWQTKYFGLELSLNALAFAFNQVKYNYSYTNIDDYFHIIKEQESDSRNLTNVTTVNSFWIFTSINLSVYINLFKS